MRCNVQFSNLGEKEKQWCARGKIYFFSSTSVNGLESKGWSLIDMHTMSRYADCMHMKCGQWPICWYAFKGMVVVVGVRTCRINTVIVLTFNLIVKLKSIKAQMGKNMRNHLMPARCRGGFPGNTGIELSLDAYFPEREESRLVQCIQILGCIISNWCGKGREGFNASQCWEPP